MVGITSIGVHIPIYRLDRSEIARMWQGRAMHGEKAVAGYDEDTITMATAAALDCMGRSNNRVDGLFFATTSAPYKEKQNAAVVAAAIDLRKRCHTAAEGRRHCAQIGNGCGQGRIRHRCPGGGGRLSYVRSPGAPGTRSGRRGRRSDDRFGRCDCHARRKLLSL
jgi:hypothetical protein